MLVTFYRSKQAFCWHSFRVYPSLASPILLAHDKSLGNQVTQDFPQMTKSSSKCRPEWEYFFVSLTRNIRCHQLPGCPFSCLGHHSCWYIMCSFHSPVQTGGSPDAAAKGLSSSNTKSTSPGSLSSPGSSVKAFRSQRGKGKQVDRADVIPDSSYLP